MITPVQKEIVDAIDKRNIFLLNKKYPTLQRIGIWLGIIGGVMSIPEHLYHWYQWIKLIHF